jgi:hypothetical protein
MISHSSRVPVGEMRVSIMCWSGVRLEVCCANSNATLGGDAPGVNSIAVFLFRTLATVAASTTPLTILFMISRTRGCEPLVRSTDAAAATAWRIPDPAVGDVPATYGVAARSPGCWAQRLAQTGPTNLVNEAKFVVIIQCDNRSLSCRFLETNFEKLRIKLANNLGSASPCFRSRSEPIKFSREGRYRRSNEGGQSAPAFGRDGHAAGQRHPLTPSCVVSAVASGPVAARRPPGSSPPTPGLHPAPQPESAKGNSGPPASGSVRPARAIG